MKKQFNQKRPISKRQQTRQQLKIQKRKEMIQKIGFLGICMAMIGGVFYYGIQMEKPQEQIIITATEGKIGETYGITRGQVAKMIALAFYTEEEIKAQEQTIDFKDMKESDWCYAYVNMVSQLGFFSGDEDGFRANDYLVVEEAQILMDRLAPDYDYEMVLTKENQKMAVSYALWVDLYQKALLTKEGSLEEFGIIEEREVLYEVNGTEAIFSSEILWSKGEDISSYENSEVLFLKKGQEVLAMLEVSSITPTLEGVYYETTEQGLRIVGDVVYTYPYRGEELEGMGAVTLADGFATIETAWDKLPDDTIRRTAENHIYLEQAGYAVWAEDSVIYDEYLERKETEDFIIGSNTTDFYVIEGKIMGAITKETPIPTEIRVLLGGGTQEKITISSDHAFSVSNAQVQQTYTAEEVEEFTIDSPWIIDTFATVSAKVNLMESVESMEIEESVESEQGDFYVTFANGETRRYTGKLEIENINGEMAVVQVVAMEEYLLGVVPYEMPSSFGTQALEAQAICARSYAYNQYYAGTYKEQGAHITDTTSSQVYKGADTTAEAIQAVQATEGLCLVHEDKVVQTYFYSTSSGFGARDVEVWSYDGSFSGEGKVYLEGKSHGVSYDMPQTESDWLTFWQDWEVEAYDQNSPWYRWKVSFSIEQLTEILQNQLLSFANTTPMKIKVQNETGEFIVGTPNDLGVLKNIEVIQRGESGVVEILELKFENKTVQIATEYAIRSCLVPTKQTIGDTIYLERKDAEALVNQSMLPSGFFAIEQSKDDTKSLQTITIYGGGYGHGVGLSQYGAKELGERGYSGAEILQEYYKDVEVVKVM